jgi:large subunit ribosomal protein L19
MKSEKYTRQTVNQIGVYDRGFPEFKVGDCIAVSLKIQEDGGKYRTQIFEGDVIAMHKNGISSTFTIRRIGANGIAIERILPFFSPAIESIRCVHQGQVRRAKLYYMRDRIGKAARVKEKVLTKEQKMRAA